MFKATHRAFIYHFVYYVLLEVHISTLIFQRSKTATLSVAGGWNCESPETTRTLRSTAAHAVVETQNN